MVEDGDKAEMVVKMAKAMVGPLLLLVSDLPPSVYGMKDSCNITGRRRQQQ